MSITKVFRVRFLNSKDEIRTFVQSAPNLTIATWKMCQKLEDHIANASHDLMHLDTTEIV